MRIVEMVPDVQSLLSLEPEELAGVLMTYLNGLPPRAEHQYLHRPSLLIPNSKDCAFSDYPPESQNAISSAFSEAWSWLEREGLLVQPPGARTADWFGISRRGATLRTRDEMAAYRH